MNFIAQSPPHLLIAGGLLAVLLLAFIAIFLIPGVLQLARLGGLHAKLVRLPAKSTPADIGRLFARDKQLAHLWSEYRDSLHAHASGALRSTVPAETWFNPQYLVDSRLRTEFFRHLPGLFTGIGIIGTFSGLIEGLHRFQVSENTAAVRSSLESLMHSVGQAFLVSAAAITAAMLSTFFEKMLLAALYRRAEGIAHTIDTLFDAAAGEEYLSRLVVASETSAHQSGALKTALVNEIGQLMRELSAAQIEAARQDSQRLGQAIATSIEQSLKGPMQAIAGSVKATSGDQSAGAARMLEQAMAGFGQRLEGLFGGQLSDLSQLNKQTALAMQDAVRSLQSAGSHLSDAGRQADHTASERMSQAMRDAGQQIGEMLDRLDQRMTASQHQAESSQQQREQHLIASTTSAVDAMSGSVEQAIQQMSAASQQMAQSVQGLSSTTHGSLDRMHAAAELVSQGAQSFATAGERVGSVLQQAAGIAAQLRELSGSMTESAGALREGLGDYRGHRDSVGLLVGELRATVELARKEASLTTDVLARIEASTERLGQAQHQSDQYLSGVTRVLAEAHQAFAEATRKTLDRANTEFHAKLATSVGLLSSTIVELESSLGNAMPRAAH